MAFRDCEQKVNSAYSECGLGTVLVLVGHCEWEANFRSIYHIFEWSNDIDNI